MSAHSSHANKADKVFYIYVKDLNVRHKNWVDADKLNIFELNYYSVHSIIRMRYNKYKALGYSLAIKHNSQTALIIYHAR